ncbi:hypothetical protein ID853_03835 [Xenorhabdus sp. Vera]|uniref:hypothetical protein n=1 Tax=Xenorhabdus koppenhoeferi TaxID=351659 RepID=UPI001995D33D|nr:hypothetical protein [Xenorhabdus sp. Vera]MBD2810032.1 hypothetical protein [Xenorhabdus sp. Vera]
MKDKYIDGITRSQIDEKINPIAREVGKNELGGGSMLVAIENEKGEIYRVITTYGLTSYMSLVNGLLELGLTDIHANDMQPNKYDSRFVHK